MATAAPPDAGLINATGRPGPSTALGGLCRWTTSDSLCYGTDIPIFLMVVVLLVLLVYNTCVTPQKSALMQDEPPSKSPLLPMGFRLLETSDLNHLLNSVNDVPLKNFLPRNNLEDLVEPCATLGIASVKDLLKANRLALRDIGFGPKEQRVFTRALERRIRLREKMQEVFLSTTASGQQRQRAPTLTQRTRAALLKNAKEKRQQQREERRPSVQPPVPDNFRLGSPSTAAAAPPDE